MEKRTTGVIATVVTAVFCGLPGLCSLCWGAIAVVAGLVPGSEIDIMGRGDPQTAITTGIAGLCLGLFFVAIPVVVGIFTLRNKKEEAEEEIVQA